MIFLPFKLINWLNVWKPDFRLANCNLISINLSSSLFSSIRIEYTRRNKSILVVWQKCWNLIKLLDMYRTCRFRMDHSIDEIPEKTTDASLKWISCGKEFFFGSVAAILSHSWQTNHEKKCIALNKHLTRLVTVHYQVWKLLSPIKKATYRTNFYSHACSMHE